MTDPVFTTRAELCPNIEDHTAFQPEGYLAWHEWAEQMSKTHKQRKCPGCGLYQIWEPRRVTLAHSHLMEDEYGTE